MAFVDEITVYAKAGKGGDGVVLFRHEKFREFGGPSGGNGGKGGDVVIRGVRDIGYLAKYQHGQQFAAENGSDGGNNSREGKNGEDVVIQLPVGSVVTIKESGRQVELLEENQEVVIAEGGKGGFGNEHFKSSRNQTPRDATLGIQGEEFSVHVELRLIADIGLIGLPNVGKTSLLNAFTNADRKVGNYQFTTLEPALGVHFGYILADIPGLIEGAASGKGLGHKFLRHIRRTKMLAHCISLESETPVQDYHTVRKELEAYDAELANKEELLILTKSDTVSDEVRETVIGELKEASGTKTLLAVSIINDDEIKELSKVLLQILKERDESAKIAE